MDTSTGPVDDQAPDHAGPSEDDIQEFAQRLRSAPAEEILADVFSTLLSTAQVKLGRRDARLFIDLCAGMLEQAGGHLHDGLTKQVEAALGQLRLGQVNAEREAAQQGEPEPEPNDLDRIPAPATGTSASAPSADRSAEPASQLWTPGR